MENIYFTEAFKALDLLEEENFNILNDVEKDEARDFLDMVPDDEEISVVDPEAHDKEDLKDSYIGQGILECDVCHSLIYKDKSDIKKEDESDLVNVGEECPICFSVDGYKLVGEVAPFTFNSNDEKPEEDVEEEPKDLEDEDNNTVDKSLTESNEEDNTLNYKGYTIELDDIAELIDIYKDGKPVVAIDGRTFDDAKDYIDLELEECMKSMHEAFEKVDIETDQEKMSMTADGDGKVTVISEPKADTIVPPSEELIDEVKVDDTEEDDTEEDEEDIEFDPDYVDETTFDELGESYLRSVYENVDSFKTVSVHADKNKLKLEGIINFNSGKSKKTQFIFEAKDANKEGNVRFLGENLLINAGKKSFVLRGNIIDNTLKCESLAYNYAVKDQDKVRRLHGTATLHRKG